MNKKIVMILFVAISILLILLLGYMGYQKFYLSSAEQAETKTSVEEQKKEQSQDEQEIKKDEEQMDKEKEPESKKEEVKPVSYTAGIPIFMYHWIRDDTGDYPWPENMVRPDSLKEQVKYLVEHQFDLIWITDLEKIYHYQKPVALTFDDGWLDVYLYMFPLAKEYNIKFSMYIIQDMVGDPGYCNEEQLKEMQASGLVDIQCHTVTHPYLAQLSYDRQKQELFNSKEYLKNTYGMNSTVICYPYGSRNENTITLAKEAGYQYGLDMDGGVYYTNTHTDLYKIPRIYATRSMSIDTYVKYANEAFVDAKWE